MTMPVHIPVWSVQCDKTAGRHSECNPTSKDLYCLDLYNLYCGAMRKCGEEP